MSILFVGVQWCTTKKARCGGGLWSEKQPVAGVFFWSSSTCSRQATTWLSIATSARRNNACCMTETRFSEKRDIELRQCKSTDVAARGSVVPQGTTRSSEKAYQAQDAVSLPSRDGQRLQRHPPAGSLPGSTLPEEPARRFPVRGLHGSVAASVTPAGVGVPAPEGGRLGIYTKSSTPPPAFWWGRGC